MTRLAIACLIAALAATAAPAQPRFHLIEATIDGIHAEMRAGRLSCTQLVQAYIERIKAYDQAGPKLNAVQNVNPHALIQAAEIDARLKASGALAGPLHCLHALFKDHFHDNFI